MKVLPGVGWGDARGSIGAVTYSRNRGGAYAKTKVSPVNPVSEFSAAVRVALATIAASWRALPTAQQTMWSDFAASNPSTNVFGNPITLTGEQMFARVNQRLQIAGLTLLVFPPADLEAPDPGVITATLVDTAPAFAMSITTTGGTATDWQVWATPPLSPGIFNFRKYLRFIGIIDDLSDLTGLYTPRFGAIPAGQVGNVVGFEIRGWSAANGQTSPPAVARAIII